MDSRELWQGFQLMSNYKVKHGTLDTEPNLPDELNNFYGRFDTKVDSQPLSFNLSGPACCFTIFNQGAGG